MSSDRRAVGVLHACLASPARPARSMALAEARLTDRRKVAALLEGAGLLSLLDRAGWRLATGWEGARISPEGRLAVGADAAAPGRSSRPAQEVLLELVLRLFGEGVADGRGEARRAVRELADLWSQSPAPVPPDDAVAAILAVAPFLWERPELAFAREALAGEIVRVDGGAWAWIAGPRPFRARLLGRPLDEIRGLLAGPGAHALWDGEESEDRLERAAALAARGRSEAALAMLGDLGPPGARVLAVRCQLELGRLGAARAALRGCEEMPLAPMEVAELAEIASRVHASHGKPGRAGYWIRRALDETGGDPRASLLARLAAAGAAWDRGDTEALERFLETSRSALDDPGLAWRWHQLRALRAGDAGDLDGAAAEAARAIRAGRRRLTRRQAAGPWEDPRFARAPRRGPAGGGPALPPAPRPGGG